MPKNNGKIISVTVKCAILIMHLMKRSRHSGIDRIFGCVFFVIEVQPQTMRLSLYSKFEKKNGLIKMKDKSHHSSSNTDRLNETVAKSVHSVKRSARRGKGSRHREFSKHFFPILCPAKCPVNRPSISD